MLRKSLAKSNTHLYDSRCFSGMGYGKTVSAVDAAKAYEPRTLAPFDTAQLAAIQHFSPVVAGPFENLRQGDMWEVFGYALHFFSHGEDFVTREAVGAEADGKIIGAH